jgi:hypothetical protein
MKPMMILLAALLVSTAACSAAGNPTTLLARGDRQVIELEEIREANVESVYDLVRARRPDWLRQRGQQSLLNDPGIYVYLDHARVGGLDAMRDIHPQSVGSVTFLDAPTANFRFGPGHLHGAIVVVSLTRG